MNEESPPRWVVRGALALAVHYDLVVYTKLTFGHTAQVGLDHHFARYVGAKDLTCKTTHIKILFLPFSSIKTIFVKSSCAAIL